MLFKREPSGKGFRMWTTNHHLGLYVMADAETGWSMGARDLNQPAIHTFDFDLTREQASHALKATTIIALGNKPGIIIIGNQQTKDKESENGYAPYQIAPEKATTDILNGALLWMDVGDSYCELTREPTLLEILRTTT